MTIPSGNLQALVLTPTVAGDAQGAMLPIPQKLHADPGGVLARQPLDGEFERLITQNLTEMDLEIILKNNGLSEVPENVSRLLSVLPGDLLATAEASDGSDWLQVLKSHFSLSDTDAEAGSEADVELPEMLPAASVTPTETLDVEPDAPVAVSLQMTVPDGETLPPQGQLTATLEAPVVPLVAAPEDEALTIRGPLLVDDNGQPVVRTLSSKEAPAAFQPVALDQAEADPEMARLIEPDNRFKLNAFSADDVAPAGQERTVRQPLAELQLAGLKSAEPVIAPQGATGSAVAAGLLTPAPAVQSPQPQAALTPDLQTLQLPQAASASQWGEALGERVALLINHKLNNAELRLDPPHLGKLDIQIQVKDDSAVIQINAHQAQTRELIDNAGQRLREVLQDAGYNSVDVNVSHREQSAQDGAEANGQGTAGAFDDPDTSVDSPVVTEIMLPGDERSPGMIDFFA